MTPTTLVHGTLIRLAVPLLVGVMTSPPSRGAPAESDPGALEAIVVTANKRDEPLQKTPAAITALSGSSLVDAGITDIRGAQDFVPSVRFQQENAATEIYIRGVGSTLDFPQVASPNVFNLNGISVPREASSAPLYDVEQLEVLPGPQGTLYGSGAMGGAVNINFRRPSQSFETRTLFEVGNDGLYHVSAAENLPIGQTLAVRAAVDYLHHEGYQTSGADSQNDLAGRLSLLYRPSGDVTGYLWASSASKDGHPPNLVPRGINPVTGALSPNSYLNANPWDDQFPAPMPPGCPMVNRVHNRRPIRTGCSAGSWMCG
jgi:iron complex outermembrane receptor protein